MEVDLVYGCRTMKVHVAFGNVKRFSITVHPDCSVTAKAPVNTPTEKITSRLNKRSEWIAEQLAFFEKHQPLLPPRQYVSGETHCYLGRQYRLHIRKGETPRIRLVGRFFEMELPDPGDREQAQGLMLAWQTRHSRQILESRVACFLPKFLSKGAPAPRISYRRMKKRWGSCSPNGTVLLNTELAKAPLHCIDYVVIHELCHLLYPNHDSKFYRLLGQMLPDWEKRKDRLEKAFL